MKGMCVVNEQLEVKLNKQTKDWLSFFDQTKENLLKDQKQLIKTMPIGIENE